MKKYIVMICIWGLALSICAYFNKNTYNAMPVEVVQDSTHVTVPSVPSVPIVNNVGYSQPINTNIAKSKPLTNKYVTPSVQKPISTYSPLPKSYVNVTHGR